MNERIRQLAEQAMVERASGFKEFDADVFAELIVRECIQSIEKTIDSNCDTDDEKMGCEYAITYLKEHFGVKE